MRFVWKESKNKLLKAQRGVSFEDVLEVIAAGKILDIIENTSSKYQGQKIYILELNEYPHFVPFQDLDEDNRELLSIIPSRKLKKKQKE